MPNAATEAPASVVCRKWRRFRKNGETDIGGDPHMALTRRLCRQGLCHSPWLKLRRGEPPRAVTSSIAATDHISRRRLDAALEHIERVDPAYFAVGGNKDRVAAALHGADDHEIVGQVEALDAELCM